MPGSTSSPPVADDLMYSQPPPPRNLRWFSRRALDMLGRIMVGALICVLGLGLWLLVIFTLHFFLYHIVPHIIGPHGAVR